MMVFGFDFFVQIADGVHLHRKSSRCVSLLETIIGAFQLCGWGGRSGRPTPSEGGKTHLPSWQSTLFSEPKVFPDSHRPHVTRGEPQPRRRAASRIR